MVILAFLLFFLLLQFLPLSSEPSEGTYGLQIGPSVPFKSKSYPYAEWNVREAS